MIPYVSRHWARLLVSPSGSFAPGVAFRVLGFGGIASIAATLDHMGYHPHLPAAPYSVVGAIIALLLTFRSNTAYSRFWEARTLWGGTVNSCRSATRMYERYAASDADDAHTFAVWVAIFAHAMRRTLRNQNGYPELQELLSEDEHAAFLASPHPALFAANRLTDAIKSALVAGRVSPMLAAAIEAEVVKLVEYLGGCERIRSTPTPLGYVLLIQRIIAVYLAALPFAFVDRIGWFAIPATVFSAYPVLLIEALGNELDDPFGHDLNDLPLTRICTKIQLNLLGFEPPKELAHARPGVVD